MSLDTKRQPAGNTRHKGKVEFRLAESLSPFLPHTQINWESSNFMCPSISLREPAWGSTHPPAPNHHVAFQLASFAFEFVHHSCHICSDLATATQQAQRTTLSGLPVMLLKSFFSPRKMEIQIQVFQQSKQV